MKDGAPRKNCHSDVPSPRASQTFATRRFFSWLPIILMVGLTGCYNHKFQSSHPPGVVKSAPPSHEVGIGVVEFDDMGELHDRCDLSPQDGQPCQIMSVLEWIRAERVRVVPNQPVPQYSVVVTFVHGWANNADPSNGDLNLFSKELEGLQEQADAQSQDVRYIGVFVGWRGSSWPGRQTYEYFPSVFNRESGARRVASVSATEVLFRIRDAAKRDLGEKGPKGKFILVGHSFGGLIVERTLAQALTALIVLGTDKTPSPRNCDANTGGSEPFADLAVLINPAIDAIETQQLIDMLKRSRFIICRKNTSFEPPLLVSIKARNDSATGWIFTIAHFAESGNKVFRNYGDAPALSSQADPSHPSQWSVYKHTAGALDFFHNYCFVETNDPGDKGCKKVNAAVNGGGNQRLAERDQYRQAFAQSPSPAPKQIVQDLYTRFRDRCDYSYCEVWNNTPYWIFTVPKDIVDGHGGWGSPKFAQLLAEIIQQTAWDRNPKKVGFR